MKQKKHYLTKHNFTKYWMLCQSETGFVSLFLFFGEWEDFKFTLQVVSDIRHLMTWFSFTSDYEENRALMEMYLGTKAVKISHCSWTSRVAS